VGSRPTTSGGFSMQLIQLVDQLVAQARAQLFSSALSQIARDRTLADVPDCGDSGGENCIKRGNSEKAVELAANETPVIKRKIALLFGNDKYLAPIPSLDTPGNDVEAVGKALSEKLGYETRIVRDAKRADIVRELNWLIGEAGADDSVYIGYAGHGFQAEKDSSGYWIPSDASNNDAAGWISNSAIAKFIKNIPARQVILVSDSCYSGTLAQEQKVQTSDTTVFDRNDVLRKRSVMVMSSGGNEPVADGGHENHSIFAYHLLRNLAAIDGNLVGSDIHRKVSAAVRKEYPQEPQYGVLLTAGHVQGGEYLIEKK